MYFMMRPEGGIDEVLYSCNHMATVGIKGLDHVLLPGCVTMLAGFVALIHSVGLVLLGHYRLSRRPVSLNGRD